MPDYFVPVETTSGTMLHANLNARGVINRAAIAEVDNRRAELLEKFSNVDSFSAGYQVSDEIENRIQTLAKEEDIEWNQEEYARSRSLISLQLKALIARDLYNSSAFYRIINEENDIFQEGLEIISDSRRYEGLLQGIGSNVGQK